MGSCSCSEYVNANGFGNCTKVYGKGPICYVNKPSNCQDLQRSTTDPDKQYSWEACEKTQGNLEY